MEYRNISICCGKVCAYEEFAWNATFILSEKCYDDHILCVYFCREHFPWLRWRRDDTRPSEQYPLFNLRLIMPELMLAVKARENRQAAWLILIRHFGELEMGEPNLAGKVVQYM